ncbi:Non-specific serine/threonine protein kinase [Bertholletia excelsa]
MESVRLLIFFLLALNSNPVFSLSVRTLSHNPGFDSNVALFGDAEVVNGGSSVRLTRPIASSSGLVVHNEPFKFLKSNPNGPISFSTDFSFSISPHSGDGIALIIVPTDFPKRFSKKKSFGISRESKFLGVEFDTSMDASVGDQNANHVGVDVSSLVSAKVGNVSSLNLVLNSGTKLRSWIDYDASSKRLEVRLGEMGNSRPYNPLIAFPIDLSEMWKEEEVFVGISSSNGDSPQSSSVYSWKFRMRSVPHSLHSLPVNPALHNDKFQEQRTEHKKNPCHLKLFSGLIFATKCGALVAFLVLSLWVLFIKWHAVLPTEYSSHPMNFGYKKVSVVVENSAECVKN